MVDGSEDPLFRNDSLDRFDCGKFGYKRKPCLNLFRGITPWRVSQYIASGLIGMKAFQSGWASVVLGVSLHYAIALIWTGIFYIVSLRFAPLTQRPLLSGVVMVAWFIS